MTNPSQLANNKYPYAISENGKTIYIQEINEENRHKTRYFCFGCRSEVFPVSDNELKEFYLASLAKKGVVSWSRLCCLSQYHLNNTIICRLPNNQKCPCSHYELNPIKAARILNRRWDFIIIKNINWLFSTIASPFRTEMAQCSGQDAPTVRLSQYTFSSNRVHYKYLGSW